MAKQWEAWVRKVDKQNGKARITVDFVYGNNSFREEYRFNDGNFDEQLKLKLELKVLGLNKAYELADQFGVGKLNFNDK